MQAAMMKHRRIVLLICGLIGLLATVAGGIGDAGAATFETDHITIVTVRGRFPMTVEMAVTQAQREQGLQFRQHLASDAGMLFDMGKVEPVSMWMLNTPISLDMVFIDGRGRVTSVVEGTTPYSLKVISSEGPVRAVLEVNAGTAARLGIQKGSRILYPIFETP